MPEFNDISNAIHREISWTQWLKDVWHTDRFMEFSKHDQVPFWVALHKRLFSIKSSFKKMLNVFFIIEMIITLII